MLRKEALREGGFGGLYHIGKCAECEPALVLLSHTPAAPTAGAQTVAWVGKGIVYDTGGLSLKVGGGMVGMKSDMGGSAAMLAAFQAAVLAGVNHPLHLVMCIAENAIGAGAVSPSLSLPPSPSSLPLLSRSLSLSLSLSLPLPLLSLFSLSPSLFLSLSLPLLSLFSHALSPSPPLIGEARGEAQVRPDDVITLHSGKTVEINNTDAEGRLVLGDGVSFAASTLAPDVLVRALQPSPTATKSCESQRQGLARGDRSWSLNDGLIPNCRVVRVHVSTGYHRVEGNRRASRNGLVRYPTPNPYDSQLSHRCITPSHGI